MGLQKSLDIGAIHASLENRHNPSEKIRESLCAALYASAKGTKHFYEALDLIKDISEFEDYAIEFEELKKRYDPQ